MRKGPGTVAPATVVLVCPRCFERDRSLVDLVQTRPPRRAGVPYILFRRYYCRKCREGFVSVERLGLEALRRAIGVPPIAREAPLAGGKYQASEAKNPESDSERDPERGDIT